MLNFNQRFLLKKYNCIQNKKILINKLICQQLYNKENIKTNNNNSFMNNEENIFKKINSIPFNKRRKNSVDTNVSSTSYNSSSSEEEEKKKDETEPHFIQKKIEINNDLKEKEEKMIKYYNKKEYEMNPEFENTEILRVEVKLAKDKKAVFKLKRYDDVFETIKLFCEINSVDERLIKPLIIKSLSAMNTIYQIMNSKLDYEQINILQKINSK